MRKSMLIFSLGIVLLTALFWRLRPQPTAVPAAFEPIASEPVTPVSAVAIEIRGGQRVGGPEVIRVAQDDTVTLLLSSDQDNELHLHGYDLHVHLQAGKPAALKFKAVHSGRFEYELHGHQQGGHAALGVIEVLPR